MANTRQDRLYDEYRVLVDIPSTIKRKMIGYKQYKKVRDSKDGKQTKTPSQN